jgi:hypothetical protein
MFQGTSTELSVYVSVYASQLSIKVVADLRKVEAELFDFLADKMGPSNVLLSAKSEWSKQNAQHTFIELLAYYRNYILAPNPGNIKAIKQTVSTYDGQVSFTAFSSNDT